MCIDQCRCSLALLGNCCQSEVRLGCFPLFGPKHRGCGQRRIICMSVVTVCLSVLAMLKSASYNCILARMHALGCLLFGLHNSVALLSQSAVVACWSLELLCFEFSPLNRILASPFPRISDLLCIQQGCLAT